MPQLKPTASTPSETIFATADSTSTPIIVLNPSATLSKAIDANTGSSPQTDLAASITIVISSRAVIVSIIKPSTPPAKSAFACSAKASFNSSGFKSPNGSKKPPLGPMSPKTYFCSPAARRAIFAAAVFISLTLSPKPRRAKANLLAPNVLVRTASLPA